MNEKQEVIWIQYIINYIVDNDYCDMFADYQFCEDSLSIDDIFCIEEQMVCEHMLEVKEK